MQAGKLNRRMMLQHPSAVQNTDGEDIQTFATTYATVWASIVPMSGQWKQLVQAMAVAAEATHKVTIRYRTDVRVTDQIQYGPTPGISFDTLNDASFDSLTDATFDALTDGTVTPPRTFRVTSIEDTDTDHRQLVLTCTELPRVN
jgi:SPP1 family predicted phage head-tail adaptor